MSPYQTRASEIPYLFHRLHHVLGTGVLLVRKREGSIGGGRHNTLTWLVMMRGEEEGNERTIAHSPPTFYTLEQQTKPNKGTNKSKRSHLIDHILSHDKRTMGQPQCAALRSNHSQKTITCRGNEVGHCLLIDPGTNGNKNSTAAQPS